MSEPNRQGKTVFSVEGSFDPCVACELRDWLAVHRGGMPVVLDFHAARDVHDLGIAVLADGLARYGIRARFRGLSQHQERILRYLGFDIGSVEQIAASVHDS